MRPLTRGDSRTLDISDLRTSDGSPAVFQAGDKVRFTVKFNWADTDSEALLRLSSTTGAVVPVTGQSIGTVGIVPTDWAVATLSTPALCVYDLELTRGSRVTTLARGQVLVNPDATLTPL